MDYFKTQLDRIQQQLGGLSASQKMLTASLVAIMVMTLVWWGRYAGESEMAPVLDTSLTSAEAGNIERSLRAASIPVKITGDRVLVPTDRRDEAIAILSIDQTLPTESSDVFDDLAKKINPFMPNSQTEAMMKASKERLLAGVIRKFPGVSAATVVITPSTGRKIGGGKEASGVVNIFMRPGQTLDAKCVNGAALLVARAESGLKPGLVSVLVNGQPQRVRDPDDPASLATSSEYAERRAAEEQRYEEKVRSAFSYIAGAIVTCSVTIDNITTQEQSRIVDPDKSLQKEIETETNSSESTGGTSGGGETGVRANIGSDPIANAGSTGSNVVTSTDRTKFLVVPNETVKTSSKPAGETKVVRASVQLPRSYFVGVAKQRAGASAAEPTEEQISALAEPTIQNIRDSVMATCNLADESAVVVSVYNDVVPMLAAAVQEVPTESAMTATITGHGKEIAVGALAVISLFMLMMMVRKGAAAPLVVPAAEPQLPQNLDTLSELAGVVGDGDPMLDGMELDEDAVKAQHMLNQVQTMVKENPDGAANLVKRWLNRT